MNKNRITISIFIVIANLLFWCLIIPYALDVLKSFYSGNDSAGIRTLYPRLATETQRFPYSFFENKIFLIGLRFNLISLLIIILVWNGFLKTIHFYTQEKKLPHINIIPTLYFLLLGIVMFEWRNDLTGIVKMNYFYLPIWFLKPFGKAFLQSFPYLYYFFLLSFPLHFFKKTKTIASIISFTTFVSCYSIIQSFGKVDHGMIPVIFCAFFYMLYRLKKNGFYIQLIWLSVGFMYFFSGLEKLTAGGLNFINGSILKVHFQNSDSEILKALSTFPFITLISVVILAFQLSFIFLIPKKKIQGVIIAAGIIFHLSITFFMGINDWINPWLLSYLWFIPILANSYPKRKSLISKERSFILKSY